MGSGQQIYDAVETLIRILADRFSSMSDQELRSESHHQRRNIGKVGKVSEPTYIGHAKEYLEMIRGAFRRE